MNETIKKRLKNNIFIRALRILKYIFIISLTKSSISTQNLWKIREKAASGKKIYCILYKRCLNANNADIPLDTQIAGMPVFPHGLTGIFISKGAKIGKNCTIFHQVTIGSNTIEDSKKQGAPEIGDNVFIGCGAKIIGGVKIGNNVRIGANCVIAKDVPDNCTVVMPKFRIIPCSEDRKQNFISWDEYEAQKAFKNEDTQENI